MTTKFFFSLSLCWLLMATIQSVFSQGICGFDAIHQRNMKDDPSYRNAVQASELKIQQYIKLHKDELARVSAVNGVLYTIPVVVHVVHTGGAVGTIYNPTDAQITGAIDYLNQVYNGSFPGTEGVGDLQIQFVLATKDPNCNSTNGIDRIDGSSLAKYIDSGVTSSPLTTGTSDAALRNLNRWDASAYYNIWVVNKIDGKDGTTGQFVAGYAQFAGAPPASDGTVMLATQMVAGVKTLPHEIGHALNLYHTFQGSADKTQCPINTDCSLDGDMVCDTDPVFDNLDAVTGLLDFTCRTGINSCIAPTLYNSNTEHNYMAYTGCYTLFTAGQKVRMLAAMSLAGRASLVNSLALPGNIHPAVFTAPIAASCTPVTSATGLSGIFAGILAFKIDNIIFSSSNASADGGYLNRANECILMVPLVKNHTYTFSATVLGVNQDQLRAWIDYNNDGVFDNATEQIYFITGIPGTGGFNTVSQTVSGTFTVPATAATNTGLRIRVLEDITFGGPLNNACVNPVYGQAEDYAAFIAASALPVKLEYFKGVKKDAGALLTWKTSFEQNVQSFTIEKSTDGVSFFSIGNVPATNNASGSIYFFTDNNMTAAVNYYRLKQTDFDLQSELSDVVAIRNDNNIAGKFKITPNPFVNQLNIVFGNTLAGNTTVNLFDVTGKKIVSKNYAVTSGQLITIDLSSLKLTAGTYILQASTANETITTKLVKQ